MLTRRELLSTTLAGSATFVAGATVAQAFTEQTMPAGAEEIVACPLCGCRMVVTADN